jgi:hypothetical protein
MHLLQWVGQLYACYSSVIGHRKSMIVMWNRCRMWAIWSAEMRTSHSNASRNLCNRQAWVDEEKSHSETRAGSEEETQTIENHHQFMIIELICPGFTEFGRSVEQHLDQRESFVTTSVPNFTRTSWDKFSSVFFLKLTEVRRAWMIRQSTDLSMFCTGKTHRSLEKSSKW